LLKSKHAWNEWGKLDSLKAIVAQSKTPKSYLWSVYNMLLTNRSDDNTKSVKGFRRGESYFPDLRLPR